MDELIKRLRNCATQTAPCKTCDMTEDGSCTDTLMKQAADAIEEQQRQIDTWIEQERKALLKSMPKWIPVTEQLPKTRESILGKKSSKVIVAFRFYDGTQGTDTAHTLNGEWVFEDHITVVARTITHWMPLPEPPKEET